MMKRFFLMILTIALSIMQLYAKQIEIGRAAYILDEDTHTAIFKTWYGGTENDSVLIIPATVDYKGETYKIVALGECAGNQNHKVKNVIIPEGVTKIEGGAFAFCLALKSITIPSSVNEIGSNTFSDCIELESIVLPEGLSSLKYHTFYHCIKLKSIVIPNSVTLIESGVFQHCI